MIIPILGLPHAAGPICLPKGNPHSQTNPMATSPTNRWLASVDSLWISRRFLQIFVVNFSNHRFAFKNDGFSKGFDTSLRRLEAFGHRFRQILGAKRIGAKIGAFFVLFCYKQGRHRYFAQRSSTRGRTPPPGLLRSRRMRRQRLPNICLPGAKRLTNRVPRPFEPLEATCRASESVGIALANFLGHLFSRAPA